MAIASFVTLGAPTCAFHAILSIKPVIPIRNNCAAAGRCLSIVATTTTLDLSSEEEVMNQVLMEEQFREGVIPRGLEQMPPANVPPTMRMDPLIASLTRDDSDSANVPTRLVPLFGDVPADGNLALLIPAATIGILGFLFSIVVAFDSRDAIIQALSSAELPKMEYTPTVVNEEKCRGLCSSQEKDLDVLRNFMETISRKD